MELMVVIAIITILAGLLFPAISRMQERGRIVTCVSNLKQLHMAALSFITDNGGDLFHPASEEWVYVADDGTVSRGFHRGWVDWHSTDSKTYWWNQANAYGVTCVTNGTLFPYVGDRGDEKVYVCPTMLRVARKRFPSDANQRNIVTRSYGMNASLQNSIWAKRYFDIAGKSRVIMFAEQGFIRQVQPGYNYALEDTGVNWEDPPFPQDPQETGIRRNYRNFDACIDWRGTVPNNPDATGNGDMTYEHIGEYHAGRGNVVFCDGHVERIKYDDTRFICSGNWDDGARIGTVTP